MRIFPKLQHKSALHSSEDMLWAVPVLANQVQLSAAMRHMALISVSKGKHHVEQGRQLSTRFAALCPLINKTPEKTSHEVLKKEDFGGMRYAPNP